MIHIHSRWLLASNRADAALLPAALVDEQALEWGTMRLLEVPETFEETQGWTSSVAPPHRVAMYELDLASGNLVGIASPTPVDTAAFLNILSDDLRRRGELAREVAADLTPRSLGRLEGVTVDSVRYELEDQEVITRFRESRRPGDLPDERLPSGVTLLLAGFESPLAVNLFADNQVYIADSSPELLGEVVRRLAIVWEGG